MLLCIYCRAVGAGLSNFSVIDFDMFLLQFKTLSEAFKRHRPSVDKAVLEVEKHLATWTLQPLAMLLGDFATDKLGVPVVIDTMRPLRAHDLGGHARYLRPRCAMAEAKTAGIEGDNLNKLLTLVNFGEGDHAA